MIYSSQNFGAALKEIIEKKKIKLRSLGNKTNLNYSYFSKLKKRKNCPPVKTIELISKGLGIPPEYFLEYRIYNVIKFLKKNPQLIDATLDYIKNLSGKDRLKVAERKKPFTKD